MKKVFYILLFAFLILSCSKSVKNNNSQNRYVITSPEIAELIYLLGAQNDVVGVTYECDYPEFYKKIKKVGNFGNVSVEKIVALKPTIVFTTKLEQDKLNAELSKLKIKVVAVYPKNIDDFLNSIIRLGMAIGKQKRAEFVADSLKSELENLKKKFNGTQKPKVYVEIYNNPVMSASSQSFLGQLIDYAGGKNIFEKLPRDYSRVKPEEIIKENPDVIISLVPNQTKKRISQRKGWQNINAVKNGRIYTVKDVNPDIVLRAGSRIIKGIKQLHKAIYNEKDD